MKSMRSKFGSLEGEEEAHAEVQRATQRERGIKRGIAEVTAAGDAAEKLAPAELNLCPGAVDVLPGVIKRAIDRLGRDQKHQPGDHRSDQARHPQKAPTQVGGVIDPFAVPAASPE